MVQWVLITTATTVALVTHTLKEAIYLVNRFIFLSDPPSTVTHQNFVNLPRAHKESGVSELNGKRNSWLSFPIYLPAH